MAWADNLTNHFGHVSYRKNGSLNAFFLKGIEQVRKEGATENVGKDLGTIRYD
jgi:hypothetical protein